MFSKERMFAGMLAVAALAGTAGVADAQVVRQYYGGWSYYPQNGYWYRYYYYKPYVGYEGYSHHYCIYYPTQPQYVYYYNPGAKVYWGRFDVKGKEGYQYSLLAEKDRKAQLKEIPESAFPKPGAMPAIPDSKDSVAIAPIKPNDLPPEDLPK